MIFPITYWKWRYCNRSAIVWVKWIPSFGIGVIIPWAQLSGNMATLSDSLNDLDGQLLNHCSTVMKQMHAFLEQEVNHVFMDK